MKKDKKTYTGKINNLKRILLTENGIEMWEVGFNTGTAIMYKGTYDTLSIKEDEVIEFKGGWFEDRFLINRIVSGNYNMLKRESLSQKDKLARHYQTIRAERLMES